MLQSQQNMLENLISFSPMKDKPPLPIYLSQRNFSSAKYEGIDFIAIEIEENSRFNAKALKNQEVQYIQVFRKNIAFQFNSMTKIQRDTLIKNKIPFISSAGQVYLPFIGVVLSEKFLAKKLVNNEKMTPTTQLLFLHLLYNAGEPILKTEAAEKLGTTKMSITRATEQLQAMKLISIETVGRKDFISRNFTAREYFTAGKEFLINPIQKTICVDSKKIGKDIVLAGETALSRISSLNQPRIPEYAIQKDAGILKGIEELSEQWSENKNLCRLQLWKYNPTLFAKNKVIDVVSLFCSFMGNIELDERIEMCLDEALEDCRW